MLKGKLPIELLSERQQYVNSLKQYVEEQKQKLQDVFEKLGLAEDCFNQVEPNQVCPYNANHFVPEKSFKKHVETCRLLSAGYQRDELPSQLQDTDFCYEGKNSLKIEIDESVLNKVIWDSCVQSGEVYTGHRSMPVSHIDENIHLTQSDRLAVYQYVVEKAHQAGSVISVDKSDELLTTDWGSLVKKGLLDAQENQNYSSKLEQLAALRDLKRRRQSYRAKNVHITKKSYTEIIREVILNQMEVLTPARSKTKTQSREGEGEERKTASKESERKRNDKGEERNSQRRRRQSRSSSRGRRRRREEKDDGQYGEGRGDTSVSRTEDSKPYDIKQVKREPESSETVRISQGYSVSRTENPQEKISDEIKDHTRSHLKRSRSQSNSSSHVSDDEESRRHHHKKSKHKKKSKHSKKHSKKHKKNKEDISD